MTDQLRKLSLTSPRVVWAYALLAFLFVLIMVLVFSHRLGGEELPGYVTSTINMLVGALIYAFKDAASFLTGGSVAEDKPKQ